MTSFLGKAAFHNLLLHRASLPRWPGTWRSTSNQLGNWLSWRGLYRSQVGFSRSANLLAKELEGLPAAEESSGQPKTQRDTLYCSFCGKSEHEVLKLVAGPSVYICDECVNLIQDINIAERHGEGRLQKLAQTARSLALEVKRVPTIALAISDLAGLLAEELDRLAEADKRG